MLVVHIRSFLARHRAVHWSIVAGLALCAGALVLREAGALERERAAWGEAASVWVAASAVAPGEQLITRAAVAPRAVLPADAVRAAPPPGAVALQRIGVGEIVTVHDVGGGAGDLVPAGWRSVAVPTDERSLPVSAGDGVDVVADGVVLVDGALVVEAGAAATTVAVPADLAPVVAASALDGRAVLVGR